MKGSISSGRKYCIFYKHYIDLDCPALGCGNNLKFRLVIVHAKYNYFHAEDAF
jgi:hypothetical protein